jgi:hypothetical protein
MSDENYRIEWSRPVTPSLPGERAYHATDGSNHILVIVTDGQLLLAEEWAAAVRESDPETSVQQIIEDAICRAVAARAFKGGELRLSDEDFAW